MSDFWQWLLGLSDSLEAWILALVESVWIYPAVFSVSFIDAVFPVVPSESIVVATASAWQSVGQPNLLLVFIAAAIGAWLGDQVTYSIGTKVDVRKIKLFRRPRVLAALDFAEQSLEKRGTLYIIAARFIPMGRVAVNLTAGALRYPRRRFTAVDALAVGIWAGWGILIGTVAATFIHDNLLLSIAVGIVGGIVLGLLVDKVLALLGFAPPELPDLTGEIEQVYDVHASRRFHSHPEDSKAEDNDKSQ